MKSVYLVAIIITIIIGSFFNWILCCEQTETITIEEEYIESVKEDYEEVVEDKKNAPVVNPLIIVDSTGSFSYKSNDNFNFHESDFIIIRPLGPGVDKGVMQVKEYLSSNKNVQITGFYEAREENTSAFPNLGYARANAVKNHLVAKGISAKQINTYGKEMDPLSEYRDVLVGPVSLVITEDAGFKNAEEVVGRIKEQPIVLYFETGKSTINLTEEQRERYLDIVRALDKVDDISVVIYGHTDNTGNAENNMILGKDRAEFIKAYLVRNGISAENIETVSKGQNEPVANNNTAEGRAENRRTVITIK
ncbi:OmpA family protein [Galbibacter sp. BG1]|uniref:OmpA family protein n=1 Tax=Galbibacter sp. BG1 TaxID=1170699 RepID=UPI0015B8CAB1|nr:OmpA family protein [Galbibacter sp. BG1]QLE01322.1 OmpA family protein [Galbibacter sp. BG1]